MRKAYILLVVVSLFSLMTYSQNFNHRYINEVNQKVGFYVGAGLSTITGLERAEQYGLPNVDYRIENFSFDPKFMWDIGFSYQYEKVNKFFLQTNTSIFNVIGAKIKGVSNKEGSDINSINTGGFLSHLFGGKKLNIKEDLNVLIGIGPCFFVNYSAGYGGSGDLIYYEKEYYDEYYGEYYYKTESFVGNGESPSVNLFGVGANAMIGIEAKNWQIGIISDYCFTKMFRDSRFNSHHKSVKLSFVYYFSNKN